MSALELAVIARPDRRTHLADVPAGTRVDTWCGLNIPTADASTELVPLVGGASARLVADLRRTLDRNTCLRCTRLAAVILSLYSARDTGKAFL